MNSSIEGGPAEDREVAPSPQSVRERNRRNEVVRQIENRNGRRRNQRNRARKKQWSNKI
jgi:hypothetical protein